MNSLVRLLQKYNGDKTNDKQSDREKNKINSMMHNLRKGISKETLEKIKKAKEPTWIAITPWSECSKLCGGGKSYLQRICIVPKNSNEHCDGERILTKDCNLQPCETNDMIFDSKQKNNTVIFNNNTNSAQPSMVNELSVIKSPIVKILPISKKPIRYERCLIKEGDLALYINDGYLKGTKIPVRVILNNSTLTVYSSDVSFIIN